ncbi:1-deoxy-D-xylulose-5-phosphate synthase [Bogoriella caseilytica]|uniref:1-deoxy-D-xylulose-5-phosphate synthase n=1 Tax=Bogoriella caseilytica TaxID=56055 RepID=A0A3N2BGA2_9MICO|nr:1-deoxy-D-xylulose-5-phosphate synthase [Bogoriella caseilytica]ROR74291.1 1-deoxy-D-xylulose-5-phosphate synthase [Bogoriella caseilytica]
MTYLERIRKPADVRDLHGSELDVLAKEIRDFLVAEVAKTGGHLGPNLGVVELTIALHRVFDSPAEHIVFDTGHQSYVHKLLTGRADFSRLRKSGGLSGYPARAESDHDVVENSHASTALSWADGIARANQLRGDDRPVVAVIGDGALTGGMAWEAVNNIAGGTDRSLVIVVNDNGRSYAPTIGGIALHLDALRATRSYEKVLSWGRRALQAGGPPGRFAFEALHGMKKGLKDAVAPQGLFEDLGMKYLGPIDGHDVLAMETALKRAKRYGGPVIVHAITEKGRGYTPAEEDVADRFHAVGAIHPETGLPVAPSRFGWTAVFADEIRSVARRRSDVVALTAAMLEPVGLKLLAEEFPERVIDVGIAEQHATTAAAGLAYAGMHPVVALYATFLNRAFDQVLMDVALHRAGVTFMLDRSGLTGDDGASHNGMWDMALLRSVPGLRLAAPRDEVTLRAAVNEAVEVDDAPTVVRYPKGSVPDPLPAVARHGSIDVLRRHSGSPRVLLVGIGAMARTAIDAAESLDAHGVGSMVVDPRWVLPISAELTELAADYDLVVTVEDGLVTNGIGSALRDALAAAGTDVPVRSHGIPHAFLEHSSRAELIDAFSLRGQDIARETLAAAAALWATDPVPEGTEP